MTWQGYPALQTGEGCNVADDNLSVRDINRVRDTED